MIKTISPSNTDILNNYFSEEELKFIDNINLTNQQLNEIYTKEKKLDTVLSTFINILNQSIENKKKTKNEQILLLEKSNKILQEIHTNISIIENLQVISTEISNKLTSLLLKSEMMPDVLKKSYTGFEDFKKDLDCFSIQNEQIKAKLLAKQTEIDSFFQDEIVLSYFKKFKIDIDDIFKTNTSQSQPQIKTNSTDEHVAFNNLINTNIDDIQDNPTLIISEKKEKVFLPYKKSEILSYMEQYPNSYETHIDVIQKEFILPLDYYMKHPNIARFREAYSLIRDREAKSIADALKYALDLMFRYELNPAIIAACKTQAQFENYLKNLEKNTLNNFTDFEIRFDVSLR